MLKRPVVFISMFFAMVEGKIFRAVTKGFLNNLPFFLSSVLSKHFIGEDGGTPGSSWIIIEERIS